MFSTSRVTLVGTVLCCLSMLLAGAFTRVASAATYYVPDDFVTIQLAFDAAADGDTILVQPGTYVENLSLVNKGIILRSLEGPGKTIIDGGGVGSVIFIDQNVTSQNYIQNFVDIEGFTLTNGYSTLGGGLCLNTRAYGTMKNCIITGNHATRWGGGVYRYYGQYNFENTRIIGNTASIGGGIYCNYIGGVTFLDGVIADNHAELDGGGIALGYHMLASAVIMNSFVSNNTAGQSGGGVHIYNGNYGNFHAYNVVISGNSAVTGGGVYRKATQEGNDSFLRTVNLTNTDNTADVGGGFYFEADSNSAYNVRMYNTIDYFNSTLSVLDDGSTVLYSNIEGGFAGAGNIDSDPLFVDSGNGDYHLLPGSPCIDSGNSSFARPYDLEMNPRPLGAGYDMGAYETVDVDEDLDGYPQSLDCNDKDPAINPGAIEFCRDVVDNDCDGLIDEDSCFKIVEICGDGLDNDANGLADCADPVCGSDPLCIEVCNDQIDNDGDGLTDCADIVNCERDAACGPKVEICYDGVDNDGNGLTDCEDLKDCANDPFCNPTIEACTDGIDNDSDGLTDCYDTNDCDTHPGCIEICDDGLDNDLDGLNDCEDTKDCGTHFSCIEMDCGDGFDNDGDGYTDCLDKDDCKKDPLCL